MWTKTRVYSYTKGSQSHILYVFCCIFLFPPHFCLSLHILASTMPNLLSIHLLNSYISLTILFSSRISTRFKRFHFINTFSVIIYFLEHSDSSYFKLCIWWCQNPDYLLIDLFWAKAIKKHSTIRTCNWLINIWKDAQSQGNENLSHNILFSHSPNWKKLIHLNSHWTWCEE